MKRQHRMPFGAQRLEDGATRFRLWAPSAQRVDLILHGDTHTELPMRASGEGWYENTVSNAGPGTRYTYRINEGLSVPDPASRSNPDDVHGPSEVIDPSAFDWQDGSWRGRPWHEAVVYETHIGCFTPEGTFAAAERRLDYLAELGITAIELMPLAQFAGGHGWGYDGVLPFAPEHAYGRADDLKHFIQAAHQRGLMVLLDVVYNHFGPEGNYLHSYAEAFFNPRHQTPWGAAINYDGEQAATVRNFFIHNALYWLEEFHFDGLRLDAVHAIADDSGRHFIQELAEAVHKGPGQDRHIHLVLENERNEAHFLARDNKERPLIATAQWNDGTHHALHVALTGELDGYYMDFAQPLQHLGRSLAEGFAYQGEGSPWQKGAPVGEPSAHLPAMAFINCLQNHDQVGNRALGERIGMLAAPQAVEAAVACLLLAPAIPMLFMGEEFDSSSPFLFFCDFGPELGAAVTAGRRAEFGRFPRFADPEAQKQIPDPVAAATFARSKLDWQEIDEPPHRERLWLYRRLLELRRRYIVPRLEGIQAPGTYNLHGPTGVHVQWALGDGARLHLQVNLGDQPIALPPAAGRVLYDSADAEASATLPPWAVLCTLEGGAPDA